MSNGGVYTWSQTSANNATADATVNWSAQMAPSAVSPSGRAMMASVAKYRDDISGQITTGGTSTAYTLSSFQVFDTLADMSGKVIAFTPHTTNGATVTLNVDSLGAKPLRSAPNVELQGGVMVAGTPYLATYNNTDGAFYLQGYYGSPYLIPLGAMIDYTGPTAPSSQFIFPAGQTISRTTYAAYFALVGTAFGVGDGSTTFNVPDLRGRVVAALDNMNGSVAGRLSGYTSVGSVGGGQTQAIGQTHLPNVNFTLSASSSTSIVDTHRHQAQASDQGYSVTYGVSNPSPANIGFGSGGNLIPVMTSGNEVFTNLSTMLTSLTGSGAITASTTTTGTANSGGSGTALPIIQPTLGLNKILRIL